MVPGKKVARRARVSADMEAKVPDRSEPVAKRSSPKKDVLEKSQVKGVIKFLSLTRSRVRVDRLNAE
jgi:hypothetical protein